MYFHLEFVLVGLPAERFRFRASREHLCARLSRTKRVRKEVEDVLRERGEL